MRRLIAALALLAATPTLAAETTFPGGATSVNERFGEWAVNCLIVESSKECVMAQAVGNAKTGQALMAAELAATEDGRIEGMLVTAFGLRFDKGIAFAIDGLQLGEARPFLTCLASGCLVPVSFDQVGVAAMKVGKALQVTGVKISDEAPVTVDLSLAGFTAAFDRTAKLSQ
jgi:invasion protein IalB